MKRATIRAFVWLARAAAIARAISADLRQWHVFLSYRSVNRLALYDVLNLGCKVFLDQYVLTAAAPLVFRR